MSFEADGTSLLPNNTNKCDPCAYDTAAVDAVAFCVDCVEYLCSSCLIHHKKIKASREHKVFTQGNMPADRQPFEKMQMISKCLYHKDLNVQYKCADHDQYICFKCERISHAKCKKQILIDISKDCVEHDKDKIRKHISTLQNHNIFAFQTELQNSILCLSKEKTRILEQRQKLTESLENAKTQLESKTSQFILEAQKTIDNLLKELHAVETFCKANKETESLLNIVLQYGSPYHQLIAADRICRDANEEVILSKCSHYRFDDTLESKMNDLKEKLLIVGREVSIEEDAPTAVDESIMTSSDNVKDDAPGTNSFDKLGEDEPCQIHQFELLPKRPEILSEKSKRQDRKKDAEPISMGSDLSTVVIDKYFPLSSGVRAERSVGANIKMIKSSEVILKGVSGNIDKLDVAVAMNGFYVVTIDHARAVLLLNENLQIVETLRLKTEPVSVCCIEKDRVAILCLEKSVRKYEIDRKVFRKYHQFKINENCSCIAANGEYEIAFLYAGKLSKLEKTSKGLDIRLEIRDHYTGNVRKVIPIDIVCQMTANLSMFSPAFGKFVISNGDVIKFFSETGKDGEIFKSEGTRVVTGDNHGNIYTFNSIHNSVVVTSKMDKRVRAYQTITNFSEVTLIYDIKSNKLVLIGFRSR